MKIGILLHPFGEKKPAGLSRAIWELTRAILARDSKNEYVIFLRKKLSEPLDLPGCNWRVEILDKKFFWLDRGLEKSPPLDIYVFNTPILPLFFKPKRSIAILYDFAYKKFKAESLKEFFKNLLLFWYHIFSIKKADKIIAISRATKEDIIKFAGIDEQKIKVMMLGFNRICALPEEKIETSQKFFLTVGVIKERKNVLGTVQAFGEFAKTNQDFKLVIAGKGQGNYFKRIKDFIKKERMADKAIFLDQVSDNQLCYLYKRARALVYPSFCEGFGLPILEAMDCGLPVITSNISSLPEVAGEAAFLIDPFDPNQIAKAMEKIAQDDKLRQYLSQVGRARAQEFSWEKTAGNFLEIIENS